MIYVRKQKELRVKNKVTPASFPSITVKWYNLSPVFLHSLHLITPITGLSHPKLVCRGLSKPLSRPPFWIICYKKNSLRLGSIFVFPWWKIRREVAKIGPILRLNKSELIQGWLRALGGSCPGPGLSNALAGQVAAILNNLFKQVWAHELIVCYTAVFGVVTHEEQLQL